MRISAWALLAVFLVALAAVPLAAGEDEGEEEGEGGEALGVAAAFTLGVTGGTAVLNLLRRRVLLPRLKGRADAVKLTMRLHRKVWLPTHLVAGVATVVLGTWHGLAVEEGSLLLWITMVLFGFLAAGGALLGWKWTPATVRKGVYLLHSQQVVFVANVALLVLGHAGVEG